MYSQLLLVMLEGAADAAGRQHHGLGLEELEAAAFAFVAERAGDAVAVFEQREDGALHVEVDALMDAVILQRADHLESRAIADVREARIAMAAEIALQDAAVLGAVEERAPGFEFAHAVGRFLGVEFGHARIVQILSAAHGVGEMDAPVVAVVDIAHGGRDAAFRHHGVGFAEQRFGNDADLHSRRGGFDGRPQTRATGADHQHIVFIQTWYSAIT